MIIYIAKNILNSKVYVGQTKRKLKIRINRHMNAADENSKIYFHRAIKKYGKHNFTWRILGTCNSHKELNEAEQICIEFFQSNDKRYGYNLTNGGGGTEGLEPWNKNQKGIYSKETLKK